MKMSIREFQIKLEPSQSANSLTVEIGTYPSGDQICAPCRVPFELDNMYSECLNPLLAHFENALNPSRLEQIGRSLASVLFPPPVISALCGALMRFPRGSGYVIRLHLKVRDARIARLPWEFAYLEDCPPMLERPGHLALLPCLHLIRQNGGEDSLTPLTLDKLKVLVAWANPSSASYPSLIFVRQEAKALVSTLSDAPYCQRLDVRELGGAGIDELSRAVEAFHPHVLHFIGHGEDAGAEPAIILEASREHNRGHYSLTCTKLASLLGYKGFRLLSLSACRTAAMAQKLTQGGIPAAIAMQLPWTDVIAVQFTQTLFGALMISAPLDEAIAQARHSIRYAGPDWGNPAMFMCGRNTALIEMKPVRPPDNLPFPRNPHFVGREDSISQIDALLNSSPAVPVAIVGMGGMGKTQLALEFAHRRISGYPGGVFWIRAADESQIRDSFDALGVLFNLPESIPDRPERVLRRIKDSPVRSLILFDNLTTSFPAKWAPCGECNHIVVTTRDVDSVRAMCRLVVLQQIEESAGAELLLARLPLVSDAEREAAREVVRRTGALPLALALVSYYADRMNLSYQESADLLSAAPIETLTNARKRFANLTGHDGSLFDTINLSYSRLEPAGKRVLNTASFFASRGISRDVLLQACGFSSDEPFREALADIESYCLAVRDSAGRYNVHELTGEYLRFRMGAKRRRSCCTAVAETLVRSLRAANTLMDWTSVRPDVYHCESAAEWCRREKLLALRFQLVYEIGVYRSFHYELDEAERAYEDALQNAREAFGSFSLLAARATMSVATTKAQLGDFDAGVDLGNAALSMAAELLPPDSSDLADYYNDIGYIEKKGGDLKRAFDMYRTALDVCTDHNCATYASIRSNLGAAYELYERFSEAIECYRDSLRIDIDLFGAEHPKIAIRLNNIGRLLTNLGRPGEALSLHENALAINRSAYGLSHPDVAASLCYCGLSEQAMSRKAHAETLYREALDIYERFFGFKDDRTNFVNRRLEELNSHALVISTEQ